MVHVPIYYSWRVTCASPEQCDTLRRSLAPAIDLDRVITDTISSFSGGIEHTWQEHHRLGDYFADIQFLPTSPEPLLFVLHRLPDATRFWKDLMVNILREIEDDPTKPKITLNAKSDEAPAEMAGAKG